MGITNSERYNEAMRDQDLIDGVPKPRRRFVTSFLAMQSQYEQAAKIMHAFTQKLREEGYVYNEASDCWEKSE